MNIGILSLLFKKKENKTPLTQKEYFEQFGINTIEDPVTGDCIPVSSNNMELVKAAYQKAWECRNFEIDKTWTRTAYCWGFIALIFTGYVVLATADKESLLADIEYVKYLSLYAILLGFLFSVGWWLVIKGSKAWQENWERHVVYSIYNIYLLINLFNKDINWYITISLVITIVIFIILLFGYPVTDYKLDMDSLKKLKEKGLNGVFIRRDKNKD